MICLGRIYIYLEAVHSHLPQSYGVPSSTRRCSETMCTVSFSSLNNHEILRQIVYFIKQPAYKHIDAIRVFDVY